MADQKLTALTANTVPVLADLLYLVDDTGGTPASKKVSVSTLADLFTNNSIYRQAIINGNFDVWQRGTSVALTTADAYTADRWYCETATAGTDKTITRQDGTGVNGSYYSARVATVQDVDELLTFSQALESQDSIKFRGRKVTLSFYAKGGAEFVADNATLVSKIVTGKGTDQKVLAFTTSADGVSQNNTLTTDWQKFTCTTSVTIASDITQIGISFAFTHAGTSTTTNYFEVTQVQLCAGTVALPFMPKSFGEELEACQRYCIGFGESETGATDAFKPLPLVALGQSATEIQGNIYLPTQMRAEPTITVTAAEWRLADGTNTIAATAITVTVAQAGARTVLLSIAVASGGTQYRSYLLQQNNDATALMILSAEL